MKKLILLLAISVWITQSNAEEATSGNLLPNAGTGQTNLQNSSGSIDGFNSTSNWTMSGTTYYPNEIEATGTGTVSANGSLSNITTEKQNGGQFTTTANSLDGGVRLNSTTEVQNCEWVGSAHQCGQASSGGGQRDTYSTTVKILDESNNVLNSTTQNRNNDAGYYGNTFTYTDTVIHNGTGARNWSWEWQGLDGGNTSSTSAIGPNLVGAELTATLLDINYTPLPPAIQTEITEVFEELFTEFEEIEQIVALEFEQEINFEEEFSITEEFQIEEEFEVVSLMEYKEPKLESFQTMKEPKMVEEFEEMPEEIVEEFEEFVEEKEEKPIMNKPMEMATNEEKKEEQPEEIAEESSSEEPTETAKAETESRTEQKEKIREAKADARLVKTLDKIDEKIKEVDKNLQAKNFIKINAMMDNSILLTYNVPFYKEDKIYEDQLNIFDNRIIYTKNLAEYQQNDPIFTQQNEINSIRLEKQKLIREIEVLKNG